jgi:FKBP-type peptidyl-prolyl cis-trans isomerase
MKVRLPALLEAWSDCERKVGGERKLIVPANLAYGKKGTDGIPGGGELPPTSQLQL